MAVPASSPTLTLSRLSWVFFPLAASWLMMGAESPITTAFVNRLPDHRVQIAAVLAMFALALFIESPVIDLLATSTTLAKSRQSYAAIRKFTVALMALSGLVHLAVAATPLFYVVFKGILRLPDDVVEALRAPMLILVPWSPAIGWRRHLQGLLIGRGITGVIGVGTFVRVSVIFLVALFGFLSHRLPGAEVAALAMTCSVTSEALFIQVFGVRALRPHPWPAEGEPLPMSRLIEFHLPLTVSTMVMLTSMPLASRALALSANGVLAMNSWQVAVSLASLMRTVTFALPEVVIANWGEGERAKLLRNFCLGVGGGLTLLMLVLAATGIDGMFFAHVTQADPEVVAGARTAFLACCLWPVMTAATSYMKGVMTVARVTVARLVATLVSVSVLAAALELGRGAGWPGVVTAAVAVTLSQASELVVLVALAWRQSVLSLRRSQKTT